MRGHNASSVKQLSKITTMVHTLYHLSGRPLHLRYICCTTCREGLGVNLGRSCMLTTLSNEVWRPAKSKAFKMNHPILSHQRVCWHHCCHTNLDHSEGNLFAPLTQSPFVIFQFPPFALILSLLPMIKNW